MLVGISLSSSLPQINDVKKNKDSFTLKGKTNTITLKGRQASEFYSCYQTQNIEVHNFAHTVLAGQKFVFKNFIIKHADMLVIQTPKGEQWFAQFLEAWLHEADGIDHLWLRVDLWKEWSVEDFGPSLFQNRTWIDYIPVSPELGYSIQKVVDSIHVGNKWIIPACFVNLK